MEKYGFYEDEKDEKFFLYVIPLLDANMDAYISVLSKNSFKFYFSCNPANTNIKRTYKKWKTDLTI